MKPILVMTNVPDRDTAVKLAERLVETRLAACVNVLAPCRSIYHWQGKTESTEEVPVMIKTTAERYAALEKAILAMHPYELPEIILVSVDGGLPAYLQWVEDNTK
jgi:periplasmic divalent cation tolerance protein